MLVFQLEILIILPLWVIAWYIRRWTNESLADLHEMHKIFVKKNAEFVPQTYDVEVKEEAHLTD